LQIDTLDQRQRFREGDLELLVSTAAQASIAINNARLHEASLRQRGVERDLELAREVQQGFLPQEAPDLPDYTFYSYYRAANHIGGDYYDYVPLSNGNLAVIVADVVGHGVAAALLMAKLSAETRDTLVSEPSPAAALTRLNAGFSGSGWEDRFVTLVLAVIDLVGHEVQVANAGHMAPLWRRADGQVVEVATQETGVPLGVAGDSEYRQASLVLAPGECLALFTDGFSEAMNVNSELYGLERLEQQLRAKASGVKQLGDRILSDVRRFVGRRAQSDDMCLICFGRV
jgi:serine phosphatase RsbU (regulator of sigma subunit)